MEKIARTTLTVFASIAVAALVAVVVLPAHARGGAADRMEHSGIRHAVLVDEMAWLPAGTPTGPACPALAQRGASTTCPYTAGSITVDARTPRCARQTNDEARNACPYLAARAARTGCPAPNALTRGAVCPFLSDMDGPKAGERAKVDDELPLGLTL